MTERFVRVLYEGDVQYTHQITQERVELREVDDGYELNITSVVSAWVEIAENLDGEWRFRMKSANGEIGPVSEGYTRKADARRGAKRAFPGLEIREV